MTLLFARLDHKARTFQYVSAGHTTGYLLDRSGAVKTHLESTGMPLGVLSDWEFEAAPTLQLEPGDLLLLLTDGVVEAHDPGAGARLDRVRRITGAVGASAPQIALSVNSVTEIASTAAPRPTIREAETVGGVSRGSCNGSHHGIGRTVPFYATVGVSRPLGEKS